MKPKIVKKWTKVVKKWTEELIELLTYIINQSLHEGIFPDDWKLQKYIPIHPKWPNHRDNYLPPHMTCANFFENYRKNYSNQRLLNYLNHNNLLTEIYHGFLKGRSTIRAIIQLVEDIVDQTENAYIVTTLFFDFNKYWSTLITPWSLKNYTTWKSMKH